MFGALASAALLVGGSLVVGQAILALCGRTTWTTLAGPVGLAALLCVAGIVAGWGGEGAAVAIALVALVAAAVVFVAVRLTWVPVGGWLIAVALATGLAAAIPFIASGQVGILGVGLVNDDMASHLLLADWIDERFRPEPVLVDQGYPLGPHALVAGLSALLATSSINVFAGLTLAIPILTALVAYGALTPLRSWPRAAASVFVALPYLAAAYLAQEAFKEPIIALFLLAFALLLAESEEFGWREAVPLGVLAAGTVYVYSFPGLAWLGGVAVIWAVLQRPRGALVGVGAGVGILALLLLPEVGRLLDFVDFRALDPDEANEGGLGNLPGHLSPLEAFGIWPTSDFRLSAGASDIPAFVFYAGGLLAVAAFALALPRWVKRHGAAIPAALLSAAALYVVARTAGTVYTSAKALAIAAPVIALVILGGLGESRHRGLRALVAVFAIAAAGSSFLILRQAPVAPTDHAEQLAEIRPLVQGEKVLFLGRDNFVLHELRGSKPYTHVRNFYDPYFVEPNFELTDVGSKFDFDSVSAETLAEFPYVLATNATYASGPPPGYDPVERTADYTLWQRGGSPEGREPAESGDEPGRLGGCPPGKVSDVSAFAKEPVVATWSQPTVESGETATAELELRPGEWVLSLRYDSTRPVTLTGAGLDVSLPGNLDYRGAAPYWPAGSFVVDEDGPVQITATVADPPLAGRLLGAYSVAHLDGIAAVPSAEPGATCDGYVDWYVR